MSASVAADMKMPIASAAAALQGTRPPLKGAEVTLKRDKIKLAADVETLLSKTPVDALKVEYSTNTSLGGRNVDLKAKYAVKKHAATIEAGTKLDGNTKLHATYAIKTKALKGKLTYVFDATTLDATHEFSTGKIQLDITRKLEGSDTLKLTTYSGSREATLAYKHDPFKLTLKVPPTADKVQAALAFEREYLW